MICVWAYRFFRWLSAIFLQKAIERSGVLMPILVSEQGVVLDGARRVKAARKLGQEVPALVIPGQILWLDAEGLKIWMEGEK